MERGDYYGLFITRADGTMYIAYFRVMYSESLYGMAVFKDDTGAIVTMRPRFAEALFPVKPEECPAIDLEDFRPYAQLRIHSGLA
jgi:hypothetical protein